ncbi:MAG: hypothetical protein M1836_005225 [Candelina mexicana]|nr:MAG: hypothetical protein M1836_005225 [Candelina mexicana]
MISSTVLEVRNDNKVRERSCHRQAEDARLARFDELSVMILNQSVKDVPNHGGSV